MLPMPGLPGFEYVRPRSAPEVVALLKEHGHAARLLMGGTDLFPKLRHGALSPRLLIDVKSVPGLREITFDVESGLKVGAAVTMNEAAAHPAVRTYYPVLAEAALSVASYQVRNRATLGGNTCNASPCADTAPAALALDAQCVLVGPDGEREMPAEAFYTGPGKTALGINEFLVALRFPLPPPDTVACYLKLGRSKLGDLAVVGVAALCFPAAVRGGYRFRVALGAVAPAPLRVRDAERLLEDSAPGEEAFRAAAEVAMQQSMPIHDVRAGIAYRKAMVRNLTLRALRQVWQQQQERVGAAGAAIADRS